MRRHIEQGDVDIAALTGLACFHNRRYQGKGSGEPGQVIDNRQTHARRRPIWFTGHEEVAGFGLH